MAGFHEAAEETSMSFSLYVTECGRRSFSNVAKVCVFQLFGSSKDIPHILFLIQHIVSVV